jgi:diguanylate cyclase (GGDEF)-like protein/PAS domain S-box-containing protein
MKNKEIANEILEVLPTLIFFKDAEGSYQYCNKALYDFFGWTEKDAIGKKADELGLFSVGEMFRKTDLALLAGESLQIYETKIVDASGNLRDLQIMKNIVLSDDGKNVIGIAGVVVDVTERNRLAAKLEKDVLLKETVLEIDRKIASEEGYNEVLGCILEKCIEVIDYAEIGAILVLDDDGYLNMPTSNGYTQESAMQFHLKLEDSFAYKQAGGIPDKILVIEDIDRITDVKFSDILLVEGKIVKTSLVSPIVVNGKFYGFINIDSNKRHAFGEEDLKTMDYMKAQIQITLSNMEEHTEKLMLMRTDYVTEIFNRRYFEELAGKGIAFSRDTGKNASLAILDIDGMKNINDAYGHVAGDFVLKSFAQEIVSSIRGCDIMGRYGGDEFAVFFPGSGKETIVKKMEKIRKNMSDNPLKYEENIITMKFSYGVSEYPVEGNKYCEIIKIADDEMYKDKNARKNEKNQCQ